MNFGLIAYGTLVEIENLQQLISENTRDLNERDEPQRADFDDDEAFQEAHARWVKKPKLCYQTVSSRRLYLGKKRGE